MGFYFGVKKEDEMDLEKLDLNGTYLVEPRSDSLEEVLRLQGVGWATRKIAAKFANNMGLELVYGKDDKLVQTYTSPVKNKIVTINLTWNETEVHDEELNAKTKVTVSYEDDGTVLVIRTVCPKKIRASCSLETKFTN